MAICRAGAITVAELDDAGVPSVLVPLPRAPGDHQMKNARALADAGGARLVLDAECTGRRAGRGARHHRPTTADDAEMAAPMHSLAHPHAGVGDRRGRASGVAIVSVFQPGVRVHVVGVGGAGMSGLAMLLVEFGAVVSGSDRGDV